MRGTIEASLNVLGAEGWRVVSTAIESPTTFSSAAFVVTLERPVA